MASVANYKGHRFHGPWLSKLPRDRQMADAIARRLAAGSTLRMTPIWPAGVTDRLWSVEKLIEESREVLPFHEVGFGLASLCAGRTTHFPLKHRHRLFVPSVANLKTARTLALDDELAVRRAIPIWRT